MKWLITGGSRGIGRGLVLRAIEDGHDVAFTFHTNADAAHAVVRDAHALRPDAVCRPYRLDVRDPAMVEAVVDLVVEEHDGLDVLVNNAGVSTDGLVFSMSDDVWHDVLATNLHGPFYVCRQALPALIASGAGRIVNVSSLVAYGSSGQANYAASKAGLHGLTRTLAKEYGRRGITANVVVPGFFETDMTREHLAVHLREFWRSYAPVPRGRTGEIHELAALVAFLASEQAGFVNGQVIHATGGLDWGP